MIDEFKALEEDEVNMMFRTPVLVAILIAGADNTIDNDEIREARELAHLKQNKEGEALRAYYQIVSKTFEDDLRANLKALPADTEARNKIIVQLLTRLNDILPKIDKRFAVNFYTSMKDLARRIAEASGGVLGYMAVGQEESEFIDLHMIKDPSTY